MMNPVDVKYMVHDIDYSDYDLTRWERKFLRRMRGKVLDGKYISDGQGKALRDIHSRAVLGRKTYKPNRSARRDRSTSTLIVRDVWLS